MASRFEARKRKILEQLDAPADDYHDLSPKGSIDEPICNLISEINGLEGLVTTSSCSGRISVFLEGRKGKIEDAVSAAEDGETRAGPGGKGGGGAWLFISHTAVDVAELPSQSNYMSMFQLEEISNGEARMPSVACRYIHLKFEPMILHILSASVAHAQRILTAALTAGFRESGAVGLSSTKSGDTNPMIAVRSTGYSFDSIIGYHDEDGRNIPIVDAKYLCTLVHIANERFNINAERIARFRKALMESYYPHTALGLSKSDWEDADTRRARKKEEGLARQRALKLQSSHDREVTELESTDTINIDDTLR
ncbi:Nn.00g095190.m01.CDS01 [Neocucurbitaria sp. VM-36]